MNDSHKKLRFDSFDLRLKNSIDGKMIINKFAKLQIIRFCQKYEYEAI